MSWCNYADFVGFSAYATSPQEPNVGEHVLFAGVMTNVGVAYDSATSVFTCPTSAFYYIYINIYMLLDATTDICAVAVMLDDEIIVHVSSIYIPLRTIIIN